MNGKRAVFIDRDGTLIVDKDYLKDPNEVEFIDGSIEAVKILNGLGYLVVIISNQSGVARGFFTIDDVERVNKRIVEVIESYGGRVDGIYYCPHYEGGIVKEFAIKCDCRKPEPGLIIRACNELGINPKESFVVGDKYSDVLLGLRVGAKSILVLTGYGRDVLELLRQKNKRHSVDSFSDENEQEFPEIEPNHIAENLLDAVKWIREITEAKG